MSLTRSVTGKESKEAKRPNRVRVVARVVARVSRVRMMVARCAILIPTPPVRHTTLLTMVMVRPMVMVMVMVAAPPTLTSQRQHQHQRQN